jgi:predicted transport protein
VELQLGETDPSHIVRVLEYWDIERKRYPQYEHTAVLVAEDVTSRFLNVLGLFNGAVPIIAIQMSALRLGESISLAFTTVLSEVTLGLVDEDEPLTELTDRAYWERQATPATVALADRILEIIRAVEPAAELKYNKYYVGLTVAGRANNFVSLVPQKASIQLHVKLPRTDEVDALLAESGLDLMVYDRQWGNYRARLSAEDLDKQKPLLADLVRRARARRLE